MSDDGLSQCSQDPMILNFMMLALQTKQESRYLLLEVDIREVMVVVTIVSTLEDALVLQTLASTQMPRISAEIPDVQRNPELCLSEENAPRRLKLNGSSDAFEESSQLVLEKSISFYQLRIRALAQPDL